MGVNPLQKLDHFGTLWEKIEIFKIFPGPTVLTRARQFQPLNMTFLKTHPVVRWKHDTIILLI